MTKFVAHYEDRAKTTAACADEESYLDVANDPASAVTKRFTTLDAAVAWLVAAVNAELTVFGCGEIREMDLVKNRCEACICRGEQMSRRHIVTDDGIEESFEEESDCI